MVGIMSHERPLQQELIKSLEELSDKSPYYKQLRQIIDDLNKPKVIIPPEDYKNVIEFVLRLIKYMPGVLDNENKDEALKKLCIRCIQQMKVLDELKTNSFKKR